MSVSQPQQIMMTQPTYAGGDDISALPVDNIPPPHDDLEIVDNLFPMQSLPMQIVASESKDAIIVGLLFIIFSLPPVDETIRKFLPVMEKAPYLLIFAKAFAFIILFWILKNFYLSRKQ
jgi:hypothetical protein